MSVKIKPLSLATLPTALALIDRIFPHVTGWEQAKFVLPLSLLPKRLAALILTFADIIDLHYWVAVDDTGSVLGVTGLYTYKRDGNAAVWLGWTCVTSAARGQGIGKTLIDFAIAQAKALGKPYLRLYTLDHPNTAVARRIYQKKGFEAMRIDSRQQPATIYEELKLTEAGTHHIRDRFD